MRRRVKHILFKLPLIFLLSVLLLPVIEAGATHIVGGELNYTNLGGNNYRIELKLYKDCGTSIVPFDDPAMIYVYGSDDQFINSFEIPIVERDTLNAVLLDPCLLVPPDVCVDFARYELEVNLPAIPDDYTLAYIRCCRNATILNAEGVDEFGNPLPPDLIGATYSARIPASPTVNSNPVFNELPPIILCSGQDIAVDQSAFDADGDQLVYSLCTPNVGGSLVTVFGDPLQERPPFEQVVWVDPYGINDILGADPPLRIDSQTGMLSGMAPFTIGQFVVGVCVQEFRNGTLLSENKRDFQFNVAECVEAIVTEYEIEPEPYQDTLEVQFQGTSLEYVLLCDTNLAVQFYSLTEGSDTVVWSFGDGSPPILADDPIHIFPDTGFYVVTLLAGPGNTCADTFRYLINVQLQRSFADMSFGMPQCYDPQSGLQFTDETTDAEPVMSWRWDFGDGGQSQQQHPVYFYNDDGDYQVSLEIIETTGCRTRLDTTLTIIRLDEVSLSDTLSLCGGDSVRIDLEIDGEHLYNWSPTGSLSQADIQDPVAFPTESTIYTVDILTIRPSGDTCYQEASITVLVDEGLPVIADNTVINQCDNPVELEVAVDIPSDIEWSLDGSFNDIAGTGSSITLMQESGIANYYVRASAFNCTAVDTITVEQRMITIEGIDQLVCRGDRTVVRPGVSSLDDDFIFDWMPDGGQINNDIPEYVFEPLQETTVTLEAANSTGCTASAEFLIEVSLLDELDAMAFPAEIPLPQEVEFQAIEDDLYTYSWEPALDFNDPALNEPAAFVDETKDFIVTVTDLNGCLHSDTVRVVLLEACDERNIFIPNAFSPNSDGLNDLFRIRSDIAESLILTIYDRWGEKVFETTEPEAGWDGTFKGVNLGNDVFGYILKVICIGGEVYVKSGSVTLMR